MLSRIIARRGLVSARSFSNRATIAQNYLVLEQLQAATDEASLTAAANSSTAVDMANLPSGLQPMQEFLSAPIATGASGFQPNRESWQNMGKAEYISEEATRHDHFPFILSAL